MKGITMTNEILKECNSKYKELKVATSKVQDVLDVMETDLETVASKFDTDAVKVSPVKIERSLLGNPESFNNLNSLILSFLSRLSLIGKPESFNNLFFCNSFNSIILLF